MSMGCEHAMAVMSEYLDGELDEAQKEQLENHVMGCERCRMYLAELRATLELAGELKPQAPDVLPVVMEGLHAKDKPDEKKRRSRQLKYAATAAAVLVFGIIVIFKPFGFSQGGSELSGTENAMQSTVADEYSIEESSFAKSAEVQNVTLAENEAIAILEELPQESVAERGENYAVIDVSEAKEVLTKYNIDAQGGRIMINW